MVEKRNWQNNVIHCNNIYVSLIFFSFAIHVMNKRNKQKWIRSNGHNVCDGKRCTVMCRGHKESGDSLVMNYRQNEMTAIQTHILYLIDLAVYYLRSLRLHNGKRTQEKSVDRMSQVEQKPSHGNGCTKKAKRCWNEKAASVVSLFFVFMFYSALFFRPLSILNVLHCIGMWFGCSIASLSFCFVGRLLSGAKNRICIINAAVICLEFSDELFTRDILVFEAKYSCSPSILIRLWP